MENLVVGSLTMGQLLEGLNDNMGKFEKLANLATKSDLTLVSNEVNSLSRECGEMKQDIGDMQVQQ